MKVLTYCTDGGVRETLDLFEPEPPPSSAVPVVVNVHGGGWTSGSAALGPWTDLVETQIVSHGWVFASINYRLAPQYPWPAQIEDAKCAVRYLRSTAGALHIDPARIGVIGGSAGGQLVSMLGLAGPSAGFDVGQYLGQSSAVQAVVDDFGPADLTTPDWAGSANAERISIQVFGVPFGQASRVPRQASPVTYISAGAPPFLVQQGTDDTNVPPDQSQELVARLKAAGDSATLEMVQNAGHSFKQVGNAPISPSLQQLARDAASFFEQHLSR